MKKRSNYFANLSCVHRKYQTLSTPALIFYSSYDMKYIRFTLSNSLRPTISYLGHTQDKNYLTFPIASKVI